MCIPFPCFLLNSYLVNDCLFFLDKFNDDFCYRFSYLDTMEGAHLFNTVFRSGSVVIVIFPVQEVSYPERKVTKVCALARFS